MNFSVKVKLRRPGRADGTSLIRLQVILNGEVLPIGLKIGWPTVLFDEEKEWCLTSLPVAQRPANYKEVLALATAAAGGSIELLEKQARDFNLLIGQALAKANDVLVTHRLSKDPVALSPERFLQEYSSAGSREDFIRYFDMKLTERHRKGKIKANTYRNHTSTLNALRQFRAKVPFNTLDHRFVDEWAAYLDKHVKSLNTRWGRHKDTKTYLALARKDKIKFEDPYADFKNSSEPGKWRPLPPEEHQKLIQYYHLSAARTVHRRVLAKFLFSCSSSLRLGDLKAIGQAKLDGKELHFEMQKTFSKKLKEMMLPLTSKALRYLSAAQTEEDRPGFFDYSDQYENRVLTAIGEQLGLKTKLHHHVGRETFATDFMRHGGKLEVLQKLMDHTKIETTMKYVHVDNDMKREAIRMLDEQDDVTMAIVA